MATGSSVADFNDTLICPVCLDTFQDPRFLPCGHTLCGPNSDEKCIKKLEARDGTITCPSCIETHKMKATDATVSFTLANLVAEIKSKRMCEQHSQEIVCYCETDEQEFCMTCWQLHHLGGNHKVAPISTKADRKVLKKWRELDSKQLEDNSRKEIELIITLETTLKQLKDREMGFHESLAVLMDDDRDSREPDSTKVKDFFALKLKKTEDDLNDWQFLVGQVGPRTAPTISAFHGSGSGEDQIHVTSTYHQVRPSVPMWRKMRLKSSMEIWATYYSKPIFCSVEKDFYVQSTSSSFTWYKYELTDHSFKFQEVYQFAKPISCIALGPESSIYISFKSQEADVCQYFRKTGRIATIDVSKVSQKIKSMTSFANKYILLLETDKNWFVFKNNKFIKIVTSNRGSFVNQESGPDYGFFAEVGNNDRWILQRFSFMELEQPVEDSDKECTISMYPITGTNCSRFCCLDSSMFTSEKRRLITLTSKCKFHSTTEDYMETGILELSVFETNKFFLDAEVIAEIEVDFDRACSYRFYVSQFLSISDESAQVLAFESGQMHIIELFVLKK